MARRRSGGGGTGAWASSARRCRRNWSASAWRQRQDEETSWPRGAFACSANGPRLFHFHQMRRRRWKKHGLRTCYGRNARNPPKNPKSRTDGAVCRAAVPVPGSGSGSWPAGRGRGRRTRGSADRVAVCAGRPSGRVMRLGWWVGLPLLGAMNGTPGRVSNCPWTCHHAPVGSIPVGRVQIVILQNGRKPVSFDFEQTPGSGAALRKKIHRLFSTPHVDKSQRPR
jgi:hypothetical protein